MELGSGLLQFRASADVGVASRDRKDRPALPLADLGPRDARSGPITHQIAENLEFAINGTNNPLFAARIVVRGKLPECRQIAFSFAIRPTLRHAAGAAGHSLNPSGAGTVSE